MYLDFIYLSEIYFTCVESSSISTWRRRGDEEAVGEKSRRSTVLQVKEQVTGRKAQLLQ